MSDRLADFFNWWYVAPLAASSLLLLSGAHCASMCGPLAFTLGKNRSEMIAYQIGRGVSYIGSGVLIGWLSQRFVLNLSPVLRSIALLSLAAAFVFALRGLLFSKTHFSFFPPRMQKMLSRYLLHLSPKKSLWARFFLGTATLFLPCPQLHAFLLAASISGRPETGAGILFVLWGASLPGLWLLPQLIRQQIFPRLSPNGARFISLLIAFVALVSILGFALATTEGGANHCHDGSHP